MQLTVAGDSTVMIIDKLEENPLHDSNGKPAWAAVFSTITNTARPVSLITNSFCATGTWLSNGTRTCLSTCSSSGALTIGSFSVVNLGGNPLVETTNTIATNGLQGELLSRPYETTWAFQWHIF